MNDQERKPPPAWHTRLLSAQLERQFAGNQEDTAGRDDFGVVCVQCRSPKGEHQADTWFCPDYAHEGDSLSVLFGFRSTRFISSQVHPYNQTPAPPPPPTQTLVTDHLAAGEDAYHSCDHCGMPRKAHLQNIVMWQQASIDALQKRVDYLEDQLGISLEGDS